MNKYSLWLSTTNLYEVDKPGLFISEETVQDLGEEVTEKLAKVEKRINHAECSFIEEIAVEKYLKQVKTALDNIKWAETLVVVGIGGSDLGGRAIVEAFGEKNSPMKVLFAGDSTDPVAYRRLLDQIDLNKTVFNFVSKSGGTLETLSAYILFKNKVKKIAKNWAKHFIFTTSAKSGILKAEAERHSVMILPVSEDVGGRFSVLTPVGLLPALAAGVEIDELVAGGLEFARSPEMRQQAQALARAQYELFHQGIKVAALLTYSVQLQEFARWYRQLWAESLGKNNTGVLPVKAWGPADQHSQLQYYNEGSPLQSIWLLRVENRATNFTLTDIDVPEAKYLEGQDFNYLLKIEAEATATSLTNHGRPNATLILSELTPRSLGELFMFFELAVVYLAELFEVNCFDQPGVEESKILINQALGKR